MQTRTANATVGYITKLHVVVNKKIKKNQSEMDEEEIKMTKELIESVPESVWINLVTTATDTFKSIIKPITSVTSGVGRLIEAKFDRLIEGEKILIAENLRKADDKARLRIDSPHPNPSTIIRIIEASKDEIDINLREMWSNLIANEMVDNSVHPKYIIILSQSSVEDALFLLKTAEKSEKKMIQISANELLKTLPLLSILPSFYFEEPESINTDILEGHGLIKRSSGVWKLTKLGEGFLSSVVDPNSKVEK